MVHPLRTVLDRLHVPSESVALAIGDRWSAGAGSALSVHSPVDGSELIRLRAATVEQVRETIGAAAEAFRIWRVVPARAVASWYV